MSAELTRATRASLVALIEAEVLTLRTIRSAVRRHTDSFSAGLARVGDAARRRAAEQAIAAARGELRPLADAVAAAVLLGRDNAKAISAARLEVEWAAARRILTRAGFTVPERIGFVPADDPENRTEAELAGSSYATAWGTAFLAAAWKWTEAERGQLAKVPSAASDQLDFRVRRIATTETVKAFADARDEGMGWIAEEHKAAQWFPFLGKVWDATLDKRACPTCRNLHGTMRPWGIPFPGGDEPGYVHSNCRCAPMTTVLPIPTSLGETVAGRQVDDENPRDS